MPFRPDEMRGAGAGGAIDYRLARRHLIAEYRRGRLARHEVCDAHPELLRAGREVGEEASVDCPICEEAKLRLVSYVFGPRLPAFGRCITKRGELQAFNRRAGDFTCYVVEVCPECGWNHLARTWALGRGTASRRAAP
ncbi:MAG: DUF5318 domain-containing protein [Acidimicrobiales bacterium]|nr:DUF5318 domain-containing protein [Acidimicrobiales bacterium]